MSYLEHSLVGGFLTLCGDAISVFYSSSLLGSPNGIQRQAWLSGKGYTLRIAQEDSKWGLCSDNDETINHPISEGSKLAQNEYKKQACLGGKDDTLRISEETEILQFKQILYVQTKIGYWKWNL